MAGTMVMRSANPALGDHTFDRVPALSDTEQMTLRGTVNKTGFSLLILLFTASYIWNRGADDPALGGWILISVVAGLLVAMLTVFKQTLAPYTTPIYAALEGVALGGISVMFEARFPGIVSQAVFLTFGTLGALLLAYRSGMVRATENFKLGVVAATGGVALLYVLSFVLGFFGVSVPLIHSSGDLRDPVQRVCRGGRGPQSCSGLRLHRKGRRARRAEAYGVVWRVRIAGDPRLAVPRNSAPARQAAIARAVRHTDRRGHLQRWKQGSASMRSARRTHAALRLLTNDGARDRRGLSPALLSKLERGRLFPTLPTLLGSARSSGVGLRSPPN